MFDLLIAPWIIRILYWITQLYVILLGFMVFFNPDFINFYGLKGPFGGLLIIVVGSLHLRLFFEILMVLFKICDNTNQLKDLLKRQNQ